MARLMPRPAPMRDGVPVSPRRRPPASAAGCHARAPARGTRRSVTDYAEIMAYGIMSTPGLVVDGKVVSYGRVPSAADIVPMLGG
jgi:hypothetical protein